MSTCIYLDESGDLGWTLDKPYGKGGSSQYLTLAAVLVPTHKTHLIARVVRGFYKARKRPQKHELKSVDLNAHERYSFVQDVLRLQASHPDILFKAITVCKSRVKPAFREHPNGLYNYMVKLMLLEAMGECPQVEFIPDSRSVKVDLKHALHDYLRTELAAADCVTRLSTTPQESKDHLEIQFADILASIVWSHFEFSDPKFDPLKQVVGHKPLFFPNSYFRLSQAA
jgi:hypothetical protein